MKTWGLITIAVLLMAGMLASAGRVGAAPPLQVSEPEPATVGFFGAVTAILDATSTTGAIVLDGG